MTPDQPSMVPARRDANPASPAPEGMTPTGLSWSGAPQRPSVSLSGILNSLLRHKWLILLCTLLGGGLSYVVWTRIQPVYEATGSLWIPGGDPAMGGGGGGGGGPIATAELFRGASWVEFLRSATILDTVAVQERLFVDVSDQAYAPVLESLSITPELQAGSYSLDVSPDGRLLTLSQDGEVLDQGAPGDLIGESIGIEWRPSGAALHPGATIEFSLLDPHSAGVRLLSNLDAQTDPLGTFIRIRYSDTDPYRAAAIVNGISERTVTLAAEMTFAQVREEVSVLAEQMAATQAELNAAEVALESFRINTITLPSEQNQAIQAGLAMTRDPVFGRFFDMRVDEAEVRSDRIELERALAGFPNTGVSPGTLTFIPSVAASAELTAALSALTDARFALEEISLRYLPEHPEVQAASERVRNLEEVRIPALVADLIRQLRGREATLAEQLAESGQELSMIPTRSIEEARLSRRVTQIEELFLDLQSAHQARSLAAASSIPSLRIHDSATIPIRPSNDERLRLVAIVMIGFIGIGFAISILIDRFDPRLRTPQQLLTAFGFTVLGVVPRIRRSGRKGEISNIDQVREAFRELRTGIDFAYGFAGPIVFTVTSSGASEGKTLISSNLGVSFSELRRRTLLIDADTRRGTLHTSFGATRRPGLTDYLNGHATLEDVLQHTDHAGLDIITMGTLVAESPELLSSPRMRELIAAVRPLYDVIIVDSPPLGAGADPLVLSVLTGNLLMVVRSGTTDREFTQAKLEPLGRLPVRFLGAVLNDFIPDRLSGTKYYASYLPGYEAKSEEAGEGGWTPRKAIVSDVDEASVASGAASDSDSTR